MAKLPICPGFLIDGFPANLNQAEIFINKIQAPHKIIFLDVPEAVMSPRLKNGVNFNDSDDTIKKRIFTYLEHTKPTVDAILKKWPNISKIVIIPIPHWSFNPIKIITLKVNANRSKEAVFKDLEKIFDGWIGEHGENSYTVVCEECNRNTVTYCPHLNKWIVRYSHIFRMKAVKDEEESSLVLNIEYYKFQPITDPSQSILEYWCTVQIYKVAKH